MKRGIVTGILSGILGAGAAAAAVGNISGKSLSKSRNLANKHLALYMLMNEWVHVKQDGKSLHDYFEKHGIKKIAVYGMNFVGETLLRELKGSDIEVAYGIDQNADAIYADIDIAKPEDQLEKVDAVVVTPVFFFSEIEEALSGKIDCPIVSIEDILYEL